MLLCTLLTLLLLSIGKLGLHGQKLSSIPLQQIEKCFRSVTDSEIEGSTTTGKPFFLYYHDNAVEGFNVINSLDYKRIRRLALCIEREDSRLFEDR